MSETPEDDDEARRRRVWECKRDLREWLGLQPPSEDWNGDPWGLLEGSLLHVWGSEWGVREAMRWYPDADLVVILSVATRLHWLSVYSHIPGGPRYRRRAFVQSQLWASSIFSCTVTDGLRAVFPTISEDVLCKVAYQWRRTHSLRLRDECLRLGVAIAKRLVLTAWSFVRHGENRWESICARFPLEPPGLSDHEVRTLLGPWIGSLTQPYR